MVANIRQLEAFSAVMSTGSVTGAARMLNRSQSATSRLLQDLEASVGFALFIRKGARISPTSEALALNEVVERSLADLRRIDTRAAELLRGAERQLKIGAISALSTGLVPGAIARLRRNGSDPDVTLWTGDAETVIGWVLDRRVDVGLTSLPVDHLGIDCRLALEAPCICLLPPGHRLADQATVGPMDLAGEPFISMSNPFRLRRTVDAAFASAGVDRRIKVETGTSATACAMVAAGVGVSVVEPFGGRTFAGPSVTIHGFQPEALFHCAVIAPTSRPPRRLVTAFIDTVVETARDALPDCRFDNDGAARPAAMDFEGIQ